MSVALGKSNRSSGRLSIAAVRPHASRRSAEYRSCYPGSETSNSESNCAGRKWTLIGDEEIAENKRGGAEEWRIRRGKCGG